MPYAVGDTVIHPHHGAAVIEKTEQREREGAPHEYLVLRMTCADLVVMVPRDACEEVGIRAVVSPDELGGILGILSTPEPPAPRTWSRRFKANQRRLRSGDPRRIAEVVRNLAVRDGARGLSVGERQLLARARRILSSEVAAALGGDVDRAEERIDAALAANRGGGS